MNNEEFTDLNVIGVRMLNAMQVFFKVNFISKPPNNDFFQVNKIGVLCRLCYNTRNCVLSVYGALGLNYRLHELIAKHLPIKVCQTDSLPQVVCRECAVTLLAFDEMLRKCLIADEKLKSIAKLDLKIIAAAAVTVTEPLIATVDEDIPIIETLTKDDSASVDFELSISKEDAFSNPNQSSPVRGSDEQNERALIKGVGSDNEQSVQPPLNTTPSSANVTKFKVCQNCLRFIPEDCLPEHDSKCVANEKSTASIDKSQPAEGNHVNTLLEKLLMSDSSDVESTPENPLIFRHQCRSKGKLFICNLCNAECKNKPTFFFHAKHECPFPHFLCKLCNIDYRTGSGLKSHLKHHATDREYICETCGMAFTTRAAFRSHLPIHSDARPYKCIDCDKTFKRLPYLRYHQKSKHNKRPVVDGNKLKFMCEICSKLFRAEKWLRLHMEKHKQECTTAPQEQYFCEMCGKGHVTEISLKIHQTRKLCEKDKMFGIHGDGTLNLLERKKKIAREKARLLRERNKYLPGKHKCPVCFKLFHTPSELRYHSDVHSSEKRYECRLCGNSYKLWSSFYRHRVAHGERKLGCEHCEKRFVHLSELREHMRSHSHERPFVCHCGKSFKYSGDLTGHLNKHHGWETATA